MTRKNLEEFLEWLITPQNENEMKLFKDNNLCDDYISIKSSIPKMSLTELCDTIDNQLKSFNQELNRDDIEK